MYGSEDNRELHVAAPQLVTYPVTLTNSLSTIFTPDSKRPVVISHILICNTDSSARTCDLALNDGSTDYYFMNGYAMNANTSHKADGLDHYFIALKDGWTLKGVASATNVVDIFICVYEEQGRRVT